MLVGWYLETVPRFTVPCEVYKVYKVIELD